MSVEASVNVAYGVVLTKKDTEVLEKLKATYKADEAREGSLMSEDFQKEWADLSLSISEGEADNYLVVYVNSNNEKDNISVTSPRQAKKELRKPVRLNSLTLSDNAVQELRSFCRRFGVTHRPDWLVWSSPITSE